MGLSPSSFAYIRILIYKVFHSAYTIYTVYENINYVSHQYHSFIHLVLYLSVQRIVNEVRAVYLTLFHNQIIGAIHYDNIVSHHNIYRLCTSHMIQSSSIIQDTLNHNITIYILIICILSYILSWHTLQVWLSHSFTVWLLIASVSIAPYLHIILWSPHHL